MGNEEEQNDDTITEDNVLPPDLEKMEASEIPNITMPDVIKQHYLGVISLNDRGKPVIPESIRTDMTNLGTKHFQNMEGPFFPIKNRSMNKSWFHRELGDGRGDEVSRSWLVYSHPVLLFCFCCLLYPVLSNQAASQLVQESGFYQCDHRERICSHENSPARCSMEINWARFSRKPWNR